MTRFPKAARLLNTPAFARVRREGRQFVLETIRITTAPSPAGRPRLGLAVPRRAGGAVRRNRFKRWIREAFRELQPELPAVDLVVSPNFDRPPRCYGDVLADLQALRDRLTAAPPGDER